MQSSKEQQGEIRKPSSAINAKIEENNRMGKTRARFKKIRDTKGTFLEKAMATHSNTLAWKIPWMEEPGRLQSMGLQRVRHG